MRYVLKKKLHLYLISKFLYFENLTSWYLMLSTFDNSGPLWHSFIKLSISLFPPDTSNSTELSKQFITHP